MFIDIPGRAGLSTQKVTVLRRFQSLVHTSWVFLARCTKGIVHTQQNWARTRVIYGTNFRHAVEFSRSGRTPSRPFRANRGQPEIRYPVGSARSNTTGTARTPTWSGRLARSLVPRAWGTPARRHPSLTLAGRSESWLRLADNCNISEPGWPAQIPHRGHSAPTFPGAAAARHNAPGSMWRRSESCDLGRFAPSDKPGRPPFSGRQDPAGEFTAR
jgi:hypothetical protein